MSVPKRPYPLHQGIAEVVAVTDVTPAMRRVRFHDPAFDGGFGVEQPGEVLTLGWPGEDGELELPGSGAKRLGWIVKTTIGRVHWRNFTVRAHDPAARTVDVDFFLHGEAGRAATWALDVAVGDRLGFAGPRVHWPAAETAGWSLLVADETGLPAVLAIAETLPAGHRAIAVVEIPGPEEEQAVDTAADVDWRWLHRGDRPPGTTTALRDTVAGLVFPDGPGQVWGGAESRALRDVRRDLKARAPDLPAKLLGYWKRKD